MRIKESSGWFAACGCVLEAAGLLSDGAFKLFVYICLTCDRQTGSLACLRKLCAGNSGLERKTKKRRDDIVLKSEKRFRDLS